MGVHLGLLTVTVAGALGDIGRGLREAANMLWDTLWALVLGFDLSGAVQAFVSRDVMQRHLGDHRPATVARASFYAMVSSSCSYAASAMARSLVARGAEYVAAMVFMFASTNLVVELGIVLAVLIGWQFVAAELIGGTMMIVPLVSFGGLCHSGAGPWKAPTPGCRPAGMPAEPTTAAPPPIVTGGVSGSAPRPVGRTLRAAP